jgi:hypothetical protein
VGHSKSGDPLMMNSDYAGLYSNHAAMTEHEEDDYYVPIDQRRYTVIYRL